MKNSMEKGTDEQLKRELSFDLYGRYAIIRDIINNNRKNSEKFRVLDVGGRGNLLNRFLPNDDVFYLDPLMDSDDKNFIKDDGCAMSLEDESFDWVTSADVFEHIPNEKREAFLSENIRVARLGTILAAPFWSKEVEQAEINANANYKMFSGGEDHRWLKEHLENGLPKESEIEELLKSKNLDFQKLYNNRLFLWETLIGISFDVWNNYSDAMKESFNKFNYFYNSEVFLYDSMNPSYRKIYFIKKQNSLKNLEVNNKTIDDVLFLETIKKGIDLIAEIDVESRKSIQSNKQIIQEKDLDIQTKDQQINSKEFEIQSKIQEIEWMKSSKFWKIKIFYEKFKNLIFYFMRLVKKSLIVLKRDGFIIFLKKIIKFLVHGKSNFKIFIGKIKEYNLWISKNEKFDINEIKKEINNFKYKPKISIIIPVYNVDSKWLDKCIESVMNQFYENWELCLHDDASTKKETIECLTKWGKINSRIKISYGKVNQHISGASNEAIKLATGEFIALLDNDDELASHALFENVKLLNEHPNADFIYSDEDKLELDEVRTDPFFKPDWSPDLFLSMMYTCHLGVYRKSIINKINGFRKGYEGSQDYDLVLRFIENTVPDNIYHITKILYHWRKIPGSTADSSDSKNYAHISGKKALGDYLNRHNIEGKVLDGKFLGEYRIKRKIIENDKVSIIIPFKDQVEILKKCVNSIEQKTNYTNYELILVNNQSKEADTLNYIKSLKKIKNISILQYNKMFNFSAINNFAVKKANGKYILFLNNDTEVINPDWLNSMIEQIQRDEIGAVGAKLMYPNNTIQHAGVVMGLGIASHAFKHFSRESLGYFGLLNNIRNCSAVTAACMMVKKKTFLELNGFNEKDLTVAFNDVDLCLRIREKGYLIVYTPYAQLYHYESLSRGNDDDFKFTNPEKYKRVLAEREYMYNKWKDVIENDPYYNPNLTRTREDFSLFLN